MIIEENTRSATPTTKATDDLGKNSSFILQLFNYEMRIASL